MIPDNEKIIQISACDGEGSESIYMLTDAGNVYVSYTFINNKREVERHVRKLQIRREVKDV